MLGHGLFEGGTTQLFHPVSIVTVFIPEHTVTTEFDTEIMERWM